MVERANQLDDHTLVCYVSRQQTLVLINYENRKIFGYHQRSFGPGLAAVDVCLFGAAANGPLSGEETCCVRAYVLVGAGDVGGCGRCSWG